MFTSGAFAIGFRAGAFLFLVADALDSRAATSPISRSASVPDGGKPPGTHESRRHPAGPVVPAEDAHAVPAVDEVRASGIHGSHASTASKNTTSPLRCRSHSPHISRGDSGLWAHGRHVPHSGHLVHPAGGQGGEPDGFSPWLSRHLIHEDDGARHPFRQAASSRD